MNSRRTTFFAYTDRWLAFVAALGLLVWASTALAGIATLDVLFDLDRDEASGCTVSTSEGPAAGIDLRLRTLVDADSDEVGSVSHASCIGSGEAAFGSETLVPPPESPWRVVPGNGVTGSTLIETSIPLSVLGSGASVRIFVAATGESGSDAQRSVDGVSTEEIRLTLRAPTVPALTLLAGALLVLALVVAVRVLPREWRVVVLVLGIAAGAGLLPLSGRALLGEGFLRAWLPAEEVAVDLAGDAPVGIDLLALFANASVDPDRLWLRMDVLLEPALCLAWGTVDPGTGYSCNQEPPPDHGPFGLAVAMTFDDGPNLATTPAILAILRAEGIPATFFMLGQNLQTPAQQALALEIHQDPLFRVANHTVDHRALVSVPVAEVLAEVDTTSQRIREAIGDACYFPRYFRFPFGASDCASMGVVREQGLGVAGVNIDPVDWCYAGGAGFCSPAVAPWVPAGFRNDLPGYAVDRLLQAGGGIMLMHDIHPHTVASLPAIIAGFRAQGATFVDLDDPALFPSLNGNVAQPEAPACCSALVP